MSKRERSISIRFTDEEFDAINGEYQQELRRVLVGVHFSMSDLIRIKALSPRQSPERQRKTMSYERRTA